MVRGDLQSLDRLLEGPAFADELNSAVIDEELMEMLDIKHFRIVPPRSAMSGVYGIYFLEDDAAEALIRYAQRYRWVVEVLIKSGMTGKERLLNIGLPEDAVRFLERIIPETPQGINPVVYQILWKASDKKAYLDIATELSNERKFVPREIIERNSELSESDQGYFCQFVRHHLIESMEAVRTRRHHQGGAGGDRISVDLDKEYRVTSTGENAIPDIISEYQRLFMDEDFAPLRIDEPAEPVDDSDESQDVYEDAEIATSEEDEVVSFEQSDLSEFT